MLDFEVMMLIVTQNWIFLENPVVSRRFKNLESQSEVKLLMVRHV